MSLTGKIIRYVTSRSAKRFAAATADPGAVQRAKLLSLMARNADTEYGREHSFGSIASIDDYQTNVPVVTYEDIREKIDRITGEGATGVLTAEDPVMFAQTSGTTGNAKYIPVTPTCQGREHADVMRTWLFHAQQSHRDIFDKKIVSLVSPAIEGYTPSGAPFGSTSGQIYKNMSALVRRAYSIPYEVFEIPSYEAKYYLIMRISLEHDVRFLSTANPSSIIKMCENANTCAQEIIRDIRDGGLKKELDISATARSALMPLFRKNPERAAELSAAHEARSGMLLPADYWPRLSLIGCWKGGTVGHTVDKFDGWFDPDGRRPVPVRDWGYLSSEARGSVPLEDEGCAGALTVASNFFEFVTTDDVDAYPDDWTKWSPRTVTEIEDGQEYYILLTTTGGLYRYDINDVIKVEGFHNKTPRIVFLRKGRGMTNLTGEKLSVNQVIDSITRCSKAVGLDIDHYKAEADVQRQRYIFKIEPTREADVTQYRRFLHGVDDTLKSINIEYKAKRDSSRLENPLLYVMKRGWYENSRRAWVADGKRQFQAKTVYLSQVELGQAEAESDLDVVVEWDE